MAEFSRTLRRAGGAQNLIVPKPEWMDGILDHPIKFAHSTASYLIATETTVDLIPEINRLASTHYYELGEDPHRYKLEVDHDVYIAAVKRGLAHVTTVRQRSILEVEGRGPLCGYHVFFLRNHLHQKDRLIAQDMLSFVRPDLRNRIWVFVAMYRHSIAALKKRGVQTIFLRVKPGKADYSQLLQRRFGAELSELVYKINTGIAYGHSGDETV
jgi:hypothetical protein